MAGETGIAEWRERYLDLRDEMKLGERKIAVRHERLIAQERQAYREEKYAAFGEKLIEAGLSTTEVQRVIGTKDWDRTKMFLGDSVEKRKPGRPATKAVEHEYEIDDGFWSFGHLDSKLLVGDEFYVSVTVDDADKYEVVFYENYREGVLTIRLLDESIRDKVDWHAVGEFYNSYKPKHAGWEVVVC